jgi:hypothetical protein
MVKKIIDTGKTARRIEVTDRPARRIEPEAFAEAIGAKACGEPHSKNLDPIGLAALGQELLKRLRSSGGRPALAEATEICRVPLSAEDIKTLEVMVAQLEISSGAKPSVGQLVSVIVQAHLRAMYAAAPVAAADVGGQEPEPSDAKASLQQMIDEQIRPLRDQVRRLEAQLHAAGGLCR